MRVSLICAGISPMDQLLQKMLPYADPEDQISACSIVEMERVIPESDIVLLVPQLRMYEKTARQVADPLHIPVLLIDQKSYGYADGEKIYQAVRQAIQEDGRNGKQK